MRELIMLDDGMMIMEEGIVKAKKILDGYPKTQFNAEEFMKFYDCVYCMCTQRPPHEYSMQLYERFKRSLEESIFSMVMPSLMDKHGAPLLIKLLQTWANYKAMAKCLTGFFQYLDHHFVGTRNAASLNDVSVHCFRDLVCNELFLKFRDTAISLINQERGGEPIDQDLLKNVLTFFVEIGGQGSTYYYENFEQALLEHAASYYSQLASEWLFCNSFTDYILKFEWCLSQEKGRASQYLYQTTVEKLLQVVTWQLTGQNASKLIEKQQAESHDLATYQELLSKYATMSLGEGSSASTSQESMEEEESLSVNRQYKYTDFC